MSVARRRGTSGDANTAKDAAPSAAGTATKVAAVAAVERKAPPGKSSLLDELPAVVLLVVLYMLQGVPLGLSMGSM